MRVEDDFSSREPLHWVNIGGALHNESVARHAGQNIRNNNTHGLHILMLRERPGTTVRSDGRTEKK
jgi:hypothetical protein